MDEETTHAEELGRDLMAMTDIFKKVVAERDRYKAALEEIVGQYDAERDIPEEDQQYDLWSAMDTAKKALGHD